MTTVDFRLVDRSPKTHEMLTNQHFFRGGKNLNTDTLNTDNYINKAAAPSNAWKRCSLHTHMRFAGLVK